MRPSKLFKSSAKPKDAKPGDIMPEGHKFAGWAYVMDGGPNRDTPIYVEPAAAPHPINAMVGDVMPEGHKYAGYAYMGVDVRTGELTYALLTLKPKGNQQRQSKRPRVFSARSAHCQSMTGN
jgi:hypothetical protein